MLQIEIQVQNCGIYSFTIAYKRKLSLSKRNKIQINLEHLLAKMLNLVQKLLIRNTHCNIIQYFFVSLQRNVHKCKVYIANCTTIDIEHIAVQ